VRFIKAAYFVILGIAVMLATTMADAHAQALNPPASGSSTQPETVWNAPDYLSESERATGPKTKLELKDTMNFEECVQFKAKINGGDCSSACKAGLGLGLMQFDYYEPIALVESVPKPWATMFKDTENFISKAFTKFKDTPFGGDEGVQTLKTSMGNYPQRYYETHVWGVSIPTRFLMFVQETVANPVPNERTINMVNSLTYEIGLIVAELTGASEINSLDDFIRKFKDMIATFFTAGGYAIIKTLEAIKAIYDVVKTIYDLFTAFLELVKTLVSLVTDPLQAAIKQLVKLIMGKECAEAKPSSETSSYYTVTDWSNPGAASTGSGDGVGPVVQASDNDQCKPSEDSLYMKMVNAIKKMIKELKKKFGEIITALQLEKAFKVFANFAKSIANGFKEFTEGWSGEAGDNAKKISDVAGQCADPGWLCSTQSSLSGASTSGGPLEGSTAGQSGNPQASVSSASANVNTRIAALGGSCSNGKPVGEWGNKNLTCNDGGALESFNRAMTAVNKMQDIFRSGSIVNVMGAAAGSLIPIGLIPSYISEFDRPAWNKGTPNFVSVFNSMVASTPFLCASGEAAAAMGGRGLSGTIRNSFCIGIWGPLYPKVGAVPIDEPHTAAGITNFRGFTLAAAWGTLPVPYNGKKSGVIRFNVDHPYKGDKCYDVGTIDPRWNSKLANEGSSAALDAMTGGIAGAVNNVGSALQSMAENPLTSVQQGSKTDGYVHTYWKKTRACMSVCLTGVKWKKEY